MKVLKNNYVDTQTNIKAKQTHPYPRRTVCEMCSSELEYDKTDLRIGAWGCCYLDCPLCGYDNMLEENELCITLTKDNIEFPVHFCHTSVETGAVESCTNENIKKEINRGIEHFRNNKDGFAWFTQYGNLHICMYRYDGDEMYDVVVTNDYYQTNIPFETEDYKVG